ncbi:hypothetical protein [Streptomyces tropicalis]|uniref:Uncharacterized protein n=1 Tax=Streptomyces tropicalis TaxID=3034234 RepID=A0ABT6A6U0_9ACTN|nr:hypothetical protein [Streptomyces tropicalis]MDF3300364.1 hypothetical protein [Streptomyces tropicalis]
MIRLVADDCTVVLDEKQVTKIQFWLLELLPAWRCEVVPGPGVEIVVPDVDRQLDDITPWVLSKLEEIVGCTLHPG